MRTFSYSYLIFISLCNVSSTLFQVWLLNSVDYRCRKSLVLAWGFCEDLFWLLSPCLGIQRDFSNIFFVLLISDISDAALLCFINHVNIQTFCRENCAKQEQIKQINITQKKRLHIVGQYYQGSQIRFYVLVNFTIHKTHQWAYSILFYTIKFHILL